MGGDTSDLFEEEMGEREELDKLRALVIDLKDAGQALSDELEHFLAAAKEDCGEDEVFPAAQLALKTWTSTLSNAGLLWREEYLRANTGVYAELKLD